MPTLHFLGTGTKDTRGELSEGGFLVEVEGTCLAVDPGPGAAFALNRKKIGGLQGCIITHEDRSHDSNLINALPIKGKGRLGSVLVETFKDGAVFRLPDGVLSYITDKVSLKSLKRFSCDVLVLLARGQEKELIEKLKPRLTILTGFSRSLLKSNPLYFARELQSVTGMQTIAAQDDLVVNLVSYGAISEQKGLAKFTREKQ